MRCSQSINTHGVPHHLPSFYSEPLTIPSRRLPSSRLWGSSHMFKLLGCSQSSYWLWSLRQHGVRQTVRFHVMLSQSQLHIVPILCAYVSNACMRRLLFLCAVRTAMSHLLPKKAETCRSNRFCTCASTQVGIEQREQNLALERNWRGLHFFMARHFSFYDLELSLEVCPPECSNILPNTSHFKVINGCNDHSITSLDSFLDNLPHCASRSQSRFWPSADYFFRRRSCNWFLWVSQLKLNPWCSGSISPWRMTCSCTHESAASHKFKGFVNLKRRDGIFFLWNHRINSYDAVPFPSNFFPAKHMFFGDFRDKLSVLFDPKYIGAIFPKFCRKTTKHVFCDSFSPQIPETSTNFPSDDLIYRPYLSEITNMEQISKKLHNNHTWTIYTPSAENW